jgi:hypothetical protein
MNIYKGEEDASSLVNTILKRGYQKGKCKAAGLVVDGMKISK